MVDHCATSRWLSIIQTRGETGSPSFSPLLRFLAVSVRAGAHLRQSGLLVADLGFADGRQLLQGVAVVGERPRQPRELCPSYGAETEKARLTNRDGTSRLLPIRHRSGGRTQQSVDAADARPAGRVLEHEQKTNPAAVHGRPDGRTMSPLGDQYQTLDPGETQKFRGQNDHNRERLQHCKTLSNTVKKKELLQ